MNISRRKSFVCRNFTLVEILVVLSILGMLMGIGIGVYSLSMDKAKRARTESLVKQLEVALESFKAKHGYYPQNESGGNHHFYIDLNGMQPDTAAIEYFRRLIDYESIRNASTVEFGTGRIIVDAWGHPLYYECPGRVNTGSFDLVSPGPDGKPGSNAAFLWHTGGASKHQLQVSNPTFDTRNGDDIGNL